MYSISPLREKRPPLNRAELQRLLPKVGDQRWEIPTITEGNGYAKEPQRCVVIEVNPAHFWYTVKFENGFRESYKVPKLQLQSSGGGS